MDTRQRFHCRGNAAPAQVAHIVHKPSVLRGFLLLHRYLPTNISMTLQLYLKAWKKGFFFFFLPICKTATLTHHQPFTALHHLHQKTFISQSTTSALSQYKQPISRSCSVLTHLSYVLSLTFLITYLFSEKMVKESTLVWMSSVLMEQPSMLPFLASSLDPLNSSTTEMPLTMESKSVDQVNSYFSFPISLS